MTRRVFVCEQKSADSVAAIVSAMPAYRNALYDSIHSSLVAASNPEMDAARLKSLAKHALAGARLTKQLSPAKTTEIWQPAAWAELVGLAKSKAGVMSLLKQVASILGAEPVDGGAAGGSKKDKKRKAADGSAALSTTTTSAAAAGSSTPQSKKQKKGGKQVAVEPAVREVTLPEAEVQDESVEADEEDALAGDVSMTVSEVAAGASPSKKDKRKKDKSKRRRESAGGFK